MSCQGLYNQYIIESIFLTLSHDHMFWLSFMKIGDYACWPPLYEMVGGNKKLLLIKCFTELSLIRPQRLNPEQFWANLDIIFEFDTV